MTQIQILSSHFKHKIPCATTARLYSPDKPDKYAIRFYSVVGHRYKYLFSIMNIGVTKIQSNDGYI